MIKNPFEDGLKFSLKWEGGFVNDPADPGGATNHGVTLATAKANAVDVDGDGDTDVEDIKNLPLDVVVAIYKDKYWNALEIPEGTDPKLAIAAFDTAINCGVPRAKRWLHQTLAVQRDHYYLLNFRTIHYLEIIKKRPALNKFKNGWFNRVNELKKYLDILDYQDHTSA